MTTTKKFVISKSNLHGKVRISGAKNSALRLLAASLLTSEKIVLKNYPSSILDAQIHVEMLKNLGKRCLVCDSSIVIEETNSLISHLEWEGRSIRNTLLILGALLARTGEASVPLPGGCDIGNRKIDIHEMVLATLGARVWLENGRLFASAPNGLIGTDIYLPIRSTGATENALILGSLAKGKTIIWNPHVRPEILDLITFLLSMGAEIKVFGQERIEIVGRPLLYGSEHTVIPDNMEAITWLIATTITGGDVEILNFPFEHLEVPLIFLRESGSRFFKGDDSMIIRGGSPYPIDISTGPYPGINSDMQPIFGVYGACANGQSRIIDLRFPGRYGYAKEFMKLGINCSIEGDVLKINGGRKIIGNDVTALDLRAGAALILAGLVADGKTTISDAWQIERGYDSFFDKLKSLGGQIERQND